MTKLQIENLLKLQLELELEVFTSKLEGVKLDWNQFNGIISIKSEE